MRLRGELASRVCTILFAVRLWLQGLGFAGFAIGISRRIGRAGLSRQLKLLERILGPFCEGVQARSLRLCHSIRLRSGREGGVRIGDRLKRSGSGRHALLGLDPQRHRVKRDHTDPGFRPSVQTRTRFRVCAIGGRTRDRSGVRSRTTSPVSVSEGRNTPDRCGRWSGPWFFFSRSRAPEA